VADISSTTGLFMLAGNGKSFRYSLLDVLSVQAHEADKLGWELHRPHKNQSRPRENAFRTHHRTARAYCLFEAYAQFPSHSISKDPVLFVRLHFSSFPSELNNSRRRANGWDGSWKMIDHKALF
jgi:hypothetical protein